MSTEKQRSGELWVLMQARRLGFGRNPLRRWSDQAETVLGSWLVLWGLFGLARLPLNLRRSRDWDAEWHTVAPRWLHGQK